MHINRLEIKARIFKVIMPPPLNDNLNDNEALQLR